MRPPFETKLADRKVASLKVLLAYHETSLRDQLAYQTIRVIIPTNKELISIFKLIIVYQVLMHNRALINCQAC